MGSAPSTQNDLQLEGDDLRVHHVVDVAVDRRPLRLSAAAWERVRRGRDIVERIR